MPWYFLVRQPDGFYAWEAQPEDWEPNLDGATLYPWGMSPYLDARIEALTDFVRESMKT